MIRILLTAILALIAPIAPIASAEETHSASRQFAPVGATTGLDARVVVSMLFDRQGYLWVGSREGLYRYDGDETRAFLPDPERPGAISDVDIRVVYEADDGAIWVGTNTGGLNRLDRETGQFTTWRYDSEDSASLPDDSVYGIAEGPEGGLWAATQRGLGRLDPVTGRFERHGHEPGVPTSLAHDWGFALHRGPSGTLWVGTVGGGLHRWNPGERNFTRYDLAALTRGPEERNDVFAVHERADGELWLGTRNGVIVFDVAGETARYFETFERNGFPPLIMSMSVDNLGRYWMGTSIHGVLLVDPDRDAWSRANAAPLGTEGNLPDQAQMSVATNGEQLFVGTWGDGVFRAPLDPPPFRLLKNDEDGGPLRNAIVMSILPTAVAGRPWVGSFGGGTQHIDVRTGEILSALRNPGRFEISGVMDLAVDENGRYFAATNFGLYEFDDTGADLVLEAEAPETPGGLGAGYVSALLPGKSGNLWVGLLGSGLYLRHGESGRFTPYRHDPDDPASLSGDFITALAAGDGPELWVGTRSNGLNRCRPDPWRCERFTGRERRDGALSHFNVTALKRDRRGRLWVGTDGGGLNRVLVDDDGRVRFEHWTRDQGLLDNGIMSIEEDRDESLWLGTRHGLSRFNPLTGQAINFVEASGLPVSHFNIGASGADEDWIYFGSVEGLLAFPKGSLLEERTPAPVRITHTRAAARGEPARNLDAGAERLAIPYGDVLTVQFTVLDYSEGAHRYAYRMGPEEPWTDLGRQSQVIFHGLAPGDYDFQVRGRDVYGLWGESAPLRLTIDPPFWMTTGFRFILAALLVLTGLGLHRMRLARQRRLAEEIQRLSSKREEALEEALGNDAELKVLTPRQKEVLQLIAEGYATKEIADLLDVSVKTVEAHRANLMERLDIHDVPGLVRLAVRARLVSPHY